MPLPAKVLMNSQAGSIFLTAAEKLPTPGSAIASTLFNSSNVSLIFTFNPTVYKAFFKLKRFPTP